MTLIRGGPAGPNPDEASGAYANEVASDRAALFRALGGAQGVLSGFTYTLPASMTMNLAVGSALLEERDASGNLGTGRGYHVWNDAVTAVPFAVPDASSRVDAVVICFADVEAGALGSGVSQVGPQVIVVRGVSGTTTPRTDAQINSAVGRGGWLRYADVKIDPGNTQIQAANVTPSAYAKPDGLVGSYGLRKIVTFTASGSFDKTLYPWLRAVRVKVVGGGGSGGGAPVTGAGQCSGGSAGAGGEYAEALIAASALSNTTTVTVGAGGVGASGATGTAGGASSFGSIQANGGDAGASISAISPDGAVGTGSAGGTGGSGTADIRVPGRPGGASGRGPTASLSGVKGNGGDTPLGAGGLGVLGANGNPGLGFGGGGGGISQIQSTAAHTGGSGAPGVVIVELYG